jgi:hypothetical protein
MDLRDKFGASKAARIKWLGLLMLPPSAQKGWLGGHAQRRLQIAWIYSRRSAERPSTDTHSTNGAFGRHDARGRKLITAESQCMDQSRSATKPTKSDDERPAANTEQSLGIAAGY